MKTRLTFLLFLFALFTSCRSVQITDFRPTNKNSTLLPNLEVKVDMPSLQSAYSLGTTTTTGYGSGYATGAGSGVVSIGAFAGQSTAKVDKRIQDVLTLFERDVENNICDSNGKIKGSIVFKIPANVTKGKGKILILVPYLVTFGVSSLLGAPLYFYQTELELEVEIFNNSDTRIAKYTGYGKKSVPIALYYGYYAPIMNETGNEGGIRKANIEAFKMAMNDIKVKIDNDSKLLIEKLNK
jgi:hypothetical protein